MRIIFLTKRGSSGYQKPPIKNSWPVYVIFSVLFVLVVLIWAIEVNFFSASQEPAFPLLPASKSAELTELYARETATLNNYKILDVQKQAYQIPIQRAMELYSAEHFQPSQAAIKP